MCEDEKREMIAEAAKHYRKFMEALKIDLDDDNSRETPERVAKAFIHDLFRGLYTEEPQITSFDNQNHYDQMICQSNIHVNSVCAHHHISFTGFATVAYLPRPEGKIIGLSKLNRIVEYFARRPQVQENLTQQIHSYLEAKLEDSFGVAVYIEAKHGCVGLRGVEDPNSIMRTGKLSGAFKDDPATRDEFYRMVEMSPKCC